MRTEMSALATLGGLKLLGAVRGYFRRLPARIQEFNEQNDELAELWFAVQEQRKRKRERQKARKSSCDHKKK